MRRKKIQPLETLETKNLSQSLETSQPTSSTQSNEKIESDINPNGTASPESSLFPEIEPLPTAKKKRQSRKRKVNRDKDVIVQTIIQQYASSPFYRDDGMLPNAFEASMMVQPAINILDKLGWLDSDVLSDSVFVDIGMLALGVGMYGYRIAKQRKKAPNSQRGATQRDTEDKDSSDIETDVTNGVSAARSEAYQKIEQLLEYDHIGRKRQGLL